MLVLSVKDGDVVHIGDDVEVILWSREERQTSGSNRY